MSISPRIKECMTSKGAGVIRKMFEEGIKLKKQFGEENVFDFSLGNPDLDPPEEVLLSLEKLSKIREKNFHGYMPNAGFQFTREAMAKKTSIEQGIDVDFSCVVMSVGAAGALNSLFKAILSDGDEVIVPAPYFAEYNHYVNNYNGKIIAVPCNDDFSLNIEGIKSVLSEKTAAILINSPNNPTGKIYSEEEIKNLSEVLRFHGKKVNRIPYLICDEPYRAITYDNKKVCSTFKYYESTVIVSSFAKNLSLPGERIGYICVNPSCPDKDELVAACIFTTRILGFVNAPALFQRVVAETWNAKCDYSLYTKRRDELMSVLDAAGIQYNIPDGAFYMWCKVPEKFNGDDMDFCDHLKKFNILAAPGSGFSGKNWFRLAYCVSESCILNSKSAFVKAMEEL